MKHGITQTALLAFLLAACSYSEDAMESSVTFGDDLAFLTEHTEVLVLSSQDGNAQVAVSPAMQGRVLTSTAMGEHGASFGWINRDVIASGERQQHINVFGGEDRFWLGPEGGQFSIYFAEGDPFDMDHWYVPSGIDWDPFSVVLHEDNRILMEALMRLRNYSGSYFDLKVTREVRLLGPEATAEHLGRAPGADVDIVAFESINTITNTGETAWTREGGLLSIWILGMYNPSPTTTIVIPYQPGPEEDMGPVVNADYFGVIPAERLTTTDSAVFFKGDGMHRGKIGLSRERSAPTFGSYDAASGVLTLVQYTMPTEEAIHVNSKWEIQEDPYAGDVINSYNDGPPAPGVAPLGPFYELETSSPAAALESGASLTHVHRTFHLVGPEEALDQISIGMLGASLEQIRNAFGS